MLLPFVRLDVAVVFMRDINQKTSDTDKQIAIAKRCCASQIAHSAVPNAIAKERSVWLSYLKTLGAISTGGLSIFAVAAFLGIKPAQANITDQAANITNQTAEEEPANLTNTPESELDAPAKFSQGQPEPAGLAPTQPLEALAQQGVAQQDTITSRARIPAFTSKSLTQATEYSFAPSAIETGNSSSLQPLASTEEAVNAVPLANSLSFA